MKTFWGAAALVAALLVGNAGAQVSPRDDTPFNVGRERGTFTPDSATDGTRHTPLAPETGAGLREQLQSEGVQPEPSQSAATQGAEDWRYRWHNNQWWYWLPEGRWVIYNDGQWVDYNPQVYRAPYYARQSYRNYDPYYGSSYYGSSFYGGSPNYGDAYLGYYRSYPYGYGYGTGYLGLYPYYGYSYRGFPYYGGYYRNYPYQGSYYRDYPYYPGGYFGAYYPGGRYYGSAYRGFYRERGPWNSANLGNAVGNSFRSGRSATAGSAIGTRPR